MGISGLLPFLKKASRPFHARELNQATVAIDVYCWMHKGAFGCAEKLVQGTPTDGYILYVMRYVDLLLAHKAKPILVFDGRNLPSKAVTEKKRRENRAKYRKMAKDYLKDGKLREAKECFQRCVDITPSMAREVIQACQARNIDCIVAPYEADAQLAFLNLNGLADYIISEDSDLTLFGCDKIIFKMDSTGNGVLYEKSKLNLCLGNRADSFNFEKFRYMCIMSGCDYLPSLHGIGLGKSQKFWSRVSNTNLQQVLPKIPSYLNMPQLVVDRSYIEGFVKANNTFLYQVVFNVKTKTLQPLNEVPEREKGNDLSYAGEYLNDDLAFQMALGNVDLHTLQIVYHFDPFENRNGVTRSNYGQVTNHDSIWQPTFDPKKFLLSEVDESLASGKGDKDSHEMVTTAFGVLPKTKEVTKSLVHSASDSIVRKRKPSEECKKNSIAKKIKMDSEYSSDTVDQSEDRSSPEKIFVSKYFAKSESPDNIRARKTSLSALKESQKGRKTPKSQKDSKEAGSWFSELDKEQSLGEKFIYRTDDLSSSKTDKTGSPFSIHRPLSKVTLRSSPASSQSFKPVVQRSRDSSQENNENSATNVRNPFLKTTAKSQRSPLSERNEKDLFKIGENVESSSQSQGSSRSSILDRSQESLLSSSSVNSMDKDSFAFTPVSSQGVSSRSQESMELESTESSVTQKSSSFPSVSQSSTLPLSQGSTPRSGKKVRGPSGLLKKTKSDSKQRSLLEMWKQQ